MTLSIKDHLPVLVVVTPLIAACILPTLSSFRKLAENLTIAACLLLAVAAGLMTFLLQRGELTEIYSLGGWPAPWGIRLKADPAAVLFITTAAFVCLPTALFSKNYLSREIGEDRRIVRFYALFLMLVTAFLGMAVTNDLFNVYVLVEVSTISCCALVSSKKSPKAAEAAFTYLILATVGAAFILGGIGFLYIITGHLNMAFASSELNRIWMQSPHTVWLILSFFIVGFGVKAALFPLHVWLPDAHSTAPSPASALLSGLAVKGYLICLIKILYTVFGPELMKYLAVDTILKYAGMLAILAGSILALKQDELKKRLAYSTVAQMGYLFMGMAFVNVKGLTGTLFYLTGHGVIKSALFLSAGAMISETGKSKIRDLAGVGKKMPVAAGVFTAAGFGLIGIPLFSGFVGKWNLILGSVEGGNVLPIVVIIAGSVLCGAYLLPVMRAAFFEPAPDAPWKDPGIPQKIGMIALGALVILLGIVPGHLLKLANKAAVELMNLGLG